MKILLIGGGGREHAIAEGIKKSQHNPSLYAVMAKKNPGIEIKRYERKVEDRS